MSLEEARSLDQKILSLSAYDVTKGLMPVLKSQGDFAEFQTDIYERFNQYKQLIQKGEFTLEQLEDDIVARNAAIPQFAEIDYDEDNLSKCVEKWDAMMIEDKKEKEIKKASTNLFLSLLSGPESDIDSFEEIPPCDQDLYNTNESTPNPGTSGEDISEEEDDGVQL